MAQKIAYWNPILGRRALVPGSHPLALTLLPQWQCRSPDRAIYGTVVSELKHKCTQVLIDSSPSGFMDGSMVRATPSG